MVFGTHPKHAPPHVTYLTLWNLFFLDPVVLKHSSVFFPLHFFWAFWIPHKRNVAINWFCVVLQCVRGAHSDDSVHERTFPCAFRSFRATARLGPAPFAFSFQVRYASLIMGAHDYFAYQLCAPHSHKIQPITWRQAEDNGVTLQNLFIWESNPKDYLLVLHRPKGFRVIWWRRRQHTTLLHHPSQLFVLVGPMSSLEW